MTKMEFEILNPEAAKKAIETEPWVWMRENGQWERSFYLCSIFAVPSGKFYMPWSSNVTDEEAKADEEWYEKLQKEAEALGLYYFCEDGIFLGECKDRLETGDRYIVPERFYPKRIKGFEGQIENDEEAESISDKAWED